MLSGSLYIIRMWSFGAVIRYFGRLGVVTFCALSPIVVGTARMRKYVRALWGFCVQRELWREALVGLYSAVRSSSREGPAWARLEHASGATLRWPPMSGWLGRSKADEQAAVRTRVNQSERQKTPPAVRQLIERERELLRRPLPDKTSS